MPLVSMMFHIFLINLKNILAKVQNKLGKNKMKKIFKKIEFKISACFFVISILIISLMLFSWYKQSSSKLMTYEKEETSQEVKNASIYVAS